MTRSRSPLLTRTLVAALATATLALGLGACGSDTPTTGTPAAGAAVDGSSSSGSALVLDSGWVKAASDMTAVFGTVRNTSDRAVTVTGGSSDAADRVEVHTMVKQPDGSMKMMVKPGGLVVPAGSSVTLEPGGDHIMLIGLSSALANGDDVHLTLDSDLGELDEWHIPVRSFAGAEETYDAGHTHATDEMSMGATG